LNGDEKEIMDIISHIEGAETYDLSMEAQTRILSALELHPDARPILFASLKARIKYFKKMQIEEEEHEQSI
jgi:hypothetical protein